MDTKPSAGRPPTAHRLPLNLLLLLPTSMLLGAS